MENTFKHADFGNNVRIDRQYVIGIDNLCGNPFIQLDARQFQSSPLAEQALTQARQVNGVDPCHATYWRIRPSGNQETCWLARSMPNTSRLTPA
jgi:hypothetical protein